MTIVGCGGATPFCLEFVDRLDQGRLRAVSALLRAVIAADGHRGVGANVLEVLAEPGGGLGVLAGAERVDGLAFCRPTGDGRTWDVEVTVHPERRGNGLGGALLAAALEAIPLRGARTQADRSGGQPVHRTRFGCARQVDGSETIVPPDPPGPAGSALRVWAYQPGAVQRRLAARHRLAPALHLLQLRGPTGVAAAWEAPDGVRLRTYAAGDEGGIAAVHNAAFTTEQLTEREILTRLTRPNMGADHLVVAETAAGAIAGYCWMADPRPDGEGGAHGELVLLAVHPDHHGGGLGGALTVAGMRLLAGRGVDRCMIYADAVNRHAIHLYSKLGFRPHHTDVALTPDGSLPWP